MKLDYRSVLALLAVPPVLAMNTLASVAHAQEAAAVAEPDTFGWKNSLVAGTIFSQSAFSNWVAGGTSSHAWTTSLRGSFEQREPHFNWRQQGNLEYGLLKQEGQNVRKSVDLIEFETLYTRKINFFVDPYASAGLKTQFATGRDFDAVPDTTTSGDLIFPGTSDFADPLHLSQSMGVGRTIIAPDELRTRFGFTVRETITETYRGHAIDENEEDLQLTFDDCTDNPACDKTKVETGLESISEYAKKLAETTGFTSKLAFFYSFEQPDELDVNWRNDLTVTVLKLLSINFGLELLFDEDILNKLQTKQLLGIGVSYSLL
jgi:hypothetical protein